MRRFFYLILISLFLIPFISSSPSLDQEVYVNPFVFGFVKGDDGGILNIDTSNFPYEQSKFQKYVSGSFQDEAPLSLVSVRNNNLVIFKINASPNNFKLTDRSPLKRFYIFFDHPEYPDSNINHVLFKLDK
jgi:hypothetical protein